MKWKLFFMEMKMNKLTPPQFVRERLLGELNISQEKNSFA